ncbi:di-trans,poly-cis-decaprenylcistransferase [Magnetovibrio blakemorei]|uniref:Isoprenyl transferase n=1 Tax=Magnetovibrio blakemorei TaxID=28181 RepID=A0A1E5Q9N3_9PROT|nr:di-trans,poly-cis-decaprenylcistransferase [Magnetovibrio blakemorei]
MKPQSQLGDAPLPVHVAIIMDGNGRWASARGLPRTEGHRRGAESVRTVIKAASRLGVRYLTLFGFSSENWKRPSGEVMDLMGLLRLYLRKELAELHKQGVRFRVIGDRSRLSVDIQDLIIVAEQRTRANVGLNLVLALSYGGRAEIVNSARNMAERVKSGELDPENIDEDLFAKSLETADIPDPDLLIRTSGEQRLSNFLLWQTAYTELVFTDTLWPDFRTEEFELALSQYQSRDRRYGSVGV